MTEAFLEQALAPGFWARMRQDVDCVFDRDPAARTRFEVACLLERIHLLEQRVGTHGCIPGGTEPADECRRCDARLVCESDAALNLED